jgi:hypothetical protein
MLEKGKTNNNAPSWDDIRDLLGGKALVCPNGGNYTLGRVGDTPKCSIGGPSHTLL